MLYYEERSIFFENGGTDNRNRREDGGVRQKSNKERKERDLFQKREGGGHLMKSNCIYNVIPKDISKGVPQKHTESLQEA